MNPLWFQSAFQVKGEFIEADIIVLRSFSKNTRIHELLAGSWVYKASLFQQLMAQIYIFHCRCRQNQQNIFSAFSFYEECLSKIGQLH